MMDADEMALNTLDGAGQPDVQPGGITFEVEHEPEHRGGFGSPLTRIGNILPFPLQVRNISVREAEAPMKTRERGTPDAAEKRVRTVTALPLNIQGSMLTTPVYAKHPVCGHDMDETIKYTSRPAHAILDEKTGYARYNELIACPHCTEDVRRSRNTRHATRAIEQLFGGANIPSYAEEWNFETVPSAMEKGAVDTVIDYTTTSIERMGKGKAGINVFLYGEPGSGKTSLAISALRRYMEAGLACFLICMPDYFRLVYRGMNKDAPPELARLEESAMDVPVLVMDDFSSENPTQDTLKRIFLMIERRTAKGLTTIITSNNELEVLEHYWYMPNLSEEVQQQSGRILRRLHERFKAVYVAPWEK